MESIRIMVEEHENVLRMLKVIRNISYRVLTLDEFQTDDYRKIIDFIRNYTDKHHHGKEEDVLFDTMNKEIEKLAKSGAITGMYIEHDLGRMYTGNLEAAIEKYESGQDDARLDIIANGISYTDLLERHINKENTAMYKFAENMLNEEAKASIEERCKTIEEEALEKGVQKHYLDMLEELEDKYL